ncbi:MAG TPA: type II secretion system protein [Planctomycetes bacterium]|nr:type II secretion system protein [Planctomycetota bacterium]
MSVVTPRCKLAFTLTELLVFICVISVIALFAMPLALKQRSHENEEHAQQYLQMIGGAQHVWMQQTGSYASLRQLATTVPVPPKMTSNNISVLRAPFLALMPSMVVSDEDIAHRAGYRYQLATDDVGNTVGCWAWPNLNKYSGEVSFYFDFATSQVKRSIKNYSWKETPQGVVPLAGELLVAETE